MEDKTEVRATVDLGITVTSHAAPHIHACGSRRLHWRGIGGHEGDHIRRRNVCGRYRGWRTVAGDAALELLQRVIRLDHAVRLVEHRRATIGIGGRNFRDIERLGLDLDKLVVRPRRILNLIGSIIGLDRLVRDLIGRDDFCWDRFVALVDANRAAAGEARVAGSVLEIELLDRAAERPGFSYGGGRSGRIRVSQPRCRRCRAGRRRVYDGAVSVFDALPVGCLDVVGLLESGIDERRR